MREDSGKGKKVKKGSQALDAQLKRESYIPQ